MPKRRSLDETRALLLDAGAVMLSEKGITVSLGAISMIDVCREAGLSTAGSAYKIWETQDAFRSDLLDHLLTKTQTDSETIDQLIAITRAQRHDLPPLDEFLRSVTGDPEGWAAGGPGYGVFAALLLASRHDTVLAHRIHDSDLAMYDSLSRLYATIGEIYGLEWREPFDAMLLAITLSALAEGVASRSSIIRDVIDTDLQRPTGPTDELRSWTIYGVCVEAIVLAFTQRRTETLDPQPQPATTPQARIASTEADPAPDRPVGSPNASSEPTTDVASQDDALRRPRRRTLEETKTLILDTGAAMFVESDLDVRIGDLDLLDVCKRAGLASTGSAYKIWTTREAFRVELVRHVFEVNLRPPDDPYEVSEELGAVGNADRTKCMSLTETIRIIGGLAFRRTRPDIDANILGIGLAARHDPCLAESLRATEFASLNESAELYEAAIASFNREWRPPYSARILSLALSALAQGFSIRMMATPELVPDVVQRPTGAKGELQSWELFACAAEAIVTAFTRPSPHQTDEPSGSD